MVESVCGSVRDPYEVISSEDMLSRIEAFNDHVKEEKKKREIDWDWREDWTLLGSDVVSLFPSLSAERTSKCVRRQAESCGIKWNEIDDEWLRLYIHMNRHLSSDISQIEYLLPKKRKGKPGREPDMTSEEVKKRYVDKSEDSSWTWPEEKPDEKEVHLMVAIMLEIAVNMFFRSFVYTFGGECYLQGDGGPIGARITMCVARLVLQCWYEDFKKILDNSNIKQYLRGLYVDDRRKILDLLALGTRYNREKEIFEYSEEWLRIDEERGIDRRALTEEEIRLAMNSINPDLSFTTETELDFGNRRLPTLSFQIWSDINGIRYSYYEKSM